MLELLKKVLKPVAPSGLEEPVAAAIREEVAPYVDSIETDALGNLICVKNGTGCQPENPQSLCESSRKRLQSWWYAGSKFLPENSRYRGNR